MKAFPHQYKKFLEPKGKNSLPVVESMEITDPGMDLRDYFAAKAMQGICAGKDEAGTLVHHGYEWIASESYKIADAMLKARGSDGSP